MGSVVVLLRSLLQSKIVHYNGVVFHRDNVPVETRGHTLGHRGLTTAGGSGQSNDEDILLSKAVDRFGVEFRNKLHTFDCKQNHGRKFAPKVTRRVSHFFAAAGATL